jgi:hypothetical protein
MGYDDYVPTVQFAADGLDYVHWYDTSLLPGVFGSRSHLVMGRFFLETSEPTAIMTSQPTDWASISSFVPPSMGATNDMWRDPNRLHFAWTDGRDHSPDVYAASIPTTAYIVSCPTDTTVPPNSTAMVRIAVHNRNPAFQERLSVFRSGGRSWPGSTQQPQTVIAEGADGWVIYPVELPDTAAAGVNTITFALERSGGIPLGSCQAKITVGNVVGVADEQSHGFELGAIGPNPARGPVHVDFSLPTRGQARVTVYGIQGNRVRMLVDSEREPGTQRLTWDGRDEHGRLAPAGLYFVKLQALGRSATRSVVVLR